MDRTERMYGVSPAVAGPSTMGWRRHARGATKLAPDPGSALLDDDHSGEVRPEEDDGLLREAAVDGALEGDQAQGARPGQLGERMGKEPTGLEPELP